MLPDLRDRGHHRLAVRDHRLPGPRGLRRRQGARASCASGWRGAGSSCCSTSSQPHRARSPWVTEHPEYYVARQRGRSGARAAELRARRRRSRRGRADDPGLRPRSLLRRLARHVPAQLPPRRLSRGADRSSWGRSPSAATASAATWRCCCSRRSSRRPGATASLPARRLAAQGRPVLARGDRGDPPAPPAVHVHRRGLLGHGVGAAAGGLRLHLRQAALRSAGRARRGAGARAPAAPTRRSRIIRCASWRTTTSRAPRRRSRAPMHEAAAVVALLGARAALLSRGPARGTPGARVDAPRAPARRAGRRGAARVLWPPARVPAAPRAARRGSGGLRDVPPGVGTATRLHQQLIVSSWQAGERRLLVGRQLRRVAGAGLRRPSACPGWRGARSRWSICWAVRLTNATATASSATVCTSTCRRGGDKSSTCNPAEAGSVVHSGGDKPCLATRVGLP